MCRRSQRRSALALALGLAFVSLAACSSGSGSDPQLAEPSRTPIPVGGVDTSGVVEEDRTLQVEQYADPVTFTVVRPDVAPTKPAPAVLFLHWFNPTVSTSNHTEFLPEARALAAMGVTSVLPDLRNPWSRRPDGTEGDRTAIENEIAMIDQLYDLLAQQPGVDGSRLAVVGHDYGAMYAVAVARQGSTQSGTTRRRPLATVFAAGYARWSSRYDEEWVHSPTQEAKDAYDALFDGLDPVDLIAAARPGTSLLFQFSSLDTDVGPADRAALVAAAPEALVLSYDDADHPLDTPEPAADRLGWLTARLGVSRVESPG